MFIHRGLVITGCLTRLGVVGLGGKSFSCFLVSVPGVTRPYYTGRSSVSGQDAKREEEGVHNSFDDLVFRKPRV